ncbi:GAF domain-containing protein, partial [Streptomyces anandii]|uniref:GAF domain-containing protein n=1 Tax=Streptomyces anandii TaxID=285454 RepID=UPI001678E569
LYEESRLRERWLGANAEVTHSLMSGADESDVLKLIAERAREITGSELAAMSTPVKGTDTLTVELAIGRQADAHRGLVLPVEGTLTGEAFANGAPVTSTDVAQDDRVTAGPPRFQDLGPAVAVPIGTGEHIRGVVLLAREADARDFTDQEVDTLRVFAAQAALAMELAERRQDAEQIALLE